jgi:lipase chaperone LimK
MKRRIVVGAAVVSAAALMIVLLGRSTPTPDPSLEADSTVGIPASPAPATRAVAKPDPNSAIRVVAATSEAEATELRARLQRSSLRGAVPDGAIALDDRGRVAPDHALLRRFDWYLSLSGEFRVDEIRALLLGDVVAAHGSEVGADVAYWFDRYLGLREALAAMALSADPVVRLAQLRELQRLWFGAHAESMFGAELAELEYTITRRAVLADADLTAAQREAQLAQLEALRDDAAQIAEHESSAALLLQEQARQFDHLGLDEAQRFDERAALWGEDAAARLAQLDLEQAAWESRVDEYWRERARLLQRADLPEAGRRLRLQMLRERLFDPGERRRIEALESIGQLRPGG